MMIKLMFEKSGAYFIFTIDNKVIKGNLRGFTLPYQPSNLPEVQSQIRNSRNRLPVWFGELFKITAQEQKEYDDAKDDLALKEIIINDARRQGAKLVDVKIE